MGKNKNTIFGIIAIVFGLIVKPFVLKGEPEQYDCVRIIAYDANFFNAASIGRIDFINSVHNSTLPHIDTLIYDSKEINKLCLLLQKLKKEKDLQVNANQTISKLAIPKPTNKSLLLVQIETETLDNRVLLVFINKNTYKLVWMNQNCVDKDSSRYLMSPELKKYMNKYLPVLFD
jgi:hypothetical protein